MQPKYEPDGYDNDQYVKESLDDAASHPKYIVIEAISWVGLAVAPCPLQRAAIQKVSHGAADPESQNQQPSSDDLVTEAL
jgi:hypothetical protein